MLDSKIPGYSARTQLRVNGDPRISSSSILLTVWQQRWVKMRVSEKGGGYSGRDPSQGTTKEAIQENEESSAREVECLSQKLPSLKS